MKEVYEGIVSFLKNYQERTHVKGYVLGISGGKDSTIVAKLLVDAIGKENFIVCKPDEVVEAICEAMGKTLKGSSSVIEEISAEGTVENTESKPNIFDIHRR